MSRFISGVVLGFLANCVVCVGSTGVVHDGGYWAQLSGEAKNGYVNGYADAMRVSAEKVAQLRIAAELFHWKAASKIIPQVSSQLSAERLAPTDVIHELDKLYSNKRFNDLSLGQALQLIATKPARTSSKR